MNILFACPKCKNDVRQEFERDTDRVPCPACGVVITVNRDCFEDDRLRKCLVCPSNELFVRKNFPQRLGVGIVAVGLLLSCIPWFYYRYYWTYGILFATALLDVVLFLVVGDVVECYRCHSRYSGAGDPTSHEAFDLEVHERYRQQEARTTSGS